MQYFDQKFGEEIWFRDGAEANETNYKNFMISDEYITFLFNDYQIVAYAAGP